MPVFVAATKSIRYTGRIPFFRSGKHIVRMLALVLLLAAGCTVGERMTRLKPGMTQPDVVRVLGRPDGFKTEQGCIVLKWTNKLISGWSWDRADYFVILKDGEVVEYGAGEVRVKEVGGVQTLFIHHF